MKLRKIITAAIFAVGLLSCQSDDMTDEYIPEFTTHATRMDGENWEEGDKIGISMTGKTADKSNYSYTLTPEGEIISSGDQQLRYPYDGTTVDFSAYYPYSQAEGSEISVQAGTDLLFSNNAKSKKAGDTSVELIFTHMMCNVKVNIQKNENIDKPVRMSIVTRKSARMNILTGALTVGEEQTTVSFDKLTHIFPGYDAELTVSCGSFQEKVNLQADDVKAGETITVNLKVVKK